MKPPPFTYHDPKTVPEALELLATLENTRLLAGGQSLMPMLNFRYVQPDHIIDLNLIDGLAGIEDKGDALYIGGMTRQRDIEYADVVQKRCPLMYEAILNVGHRQTRNRGTLGGSLAHLDPSAELPTVAMALDATVHVESKSGSRTLPMSEFPMAYMTPAIELEEMVTGVTFPYWPEGHGWAFVEFARRHGDFAIVSAAALMTVGTDGKIGRASLTVSGVGPSPVRCAAAEELLTGGDAGEALFDQASETCREIDAMEDVYAASWYRQHLAAVLSKRALIKAHARATGQDGE